MRQLNKYEYARTAMKAAARSGVNYCVTALVILFTFTFILPVELSAQAIDKNIVQQIERGFSRGDTRLLLEHAADRMDIALFGISTLFSRNQAHYVLQDFFRQYPPERFALVSSSQMNGSLFLSGTYWPKPGRQVFQVILRLRSRDNLWELRDIDIRIDTRARE